MISFQFSPYTDIYFEISIIKFLILISNRFISKSDRFSICLEKIGMNKLKNPIDVIIDIDIVVTTAKNFLNFNFLIRKFTNGLRIKEIIAEIQI